MDNIQLDLRTSRLDGYSDEFGKPLDRLWSGRTTIFIGGNNSGKSRILRHIWNEWNGEIESAERASDRRDIEHYVEQVVGVITRRGLPENQMIETWQASKLSLKRDSLASIRQMAKHLNNGVVPIEDATAGAVSNELSVAEKGDMQRPLHFLSALLEKYDPVRFPRLFYVPILRGLRPLAEGDSDPYTERTLRDYGKPESQKSLAFTGATLFSDVRKLLLGHQDERTKIQAYEDFLSEHVFDKRVSLIPKEKGNNDVIHVKLGDDEERPIYDLGDGLQSLVTLTFPAFLSPGCWLLVEEPEQSLHPGMQRKLLECYRSMPSQPRVFLTTHSNHILDIATEDDDMFIYRVRKVPSQEFPHVVSRAETGNRDHLLDLGVRISSVLLCNSTLWVEGITDRWFFRRALRAYGESLPDGSAKIREDTHYSIVEYAGSNITHYDWLDKEPAPIRPDAFCGPATLVADYDGGTKEERLSLLKESLKDRFVCTEPAREVENLLPPKVLAATVNALAKPTTAVALPKHDAYKEEPIGTFIEKMLDRNDREGWKNFAAQSGTLSRKREFWEEAERHLATATWDDYPERAREVIKQIYDNIVEDNWPAPADG